MHEDSIFFHNEFIIPLRVSTFAFYFSFAFFFYISLYFHTDRIKTLRLCRELYPVFIRTEYFSRF